MHLHSVVFCLHPYCMIILSVDNLFFYLGSQSVSCKVSLAALHWMAIFVIFVLCLYRKINMMMMMNSHVRTGGRGERIAVFLDADRQSSCVQKVPVLWELWRAFVPAWRRYSYLQNLLDFFLVSIVGTMLQHDRHCNWHKVLFAGSQVDHGQHLRTWHICWHLQCALPWLYYDTCQLKQGRGFVTYRSTGTQNNNQLWHAREVERLKVSMTVGLFVFLHPPPLSLPSRTQ